MITELHLNNVGPASTFDVEFGKRLNIFTGDNGLGKTFLLDILWWGLTETWVDNSARAYQLKGDQPQIFLKPVGKYVLSEKQEWKRAGIKHLHHDLIIYIRVDGSFSIWDQARNLPDPTERIAEAYHFTPDSLWDGLQVHDDVLCNGLLRDWITWQYQPDQDELSPFRMLSRVLEHLSPSHPDELLKPGKPTRISVRDVRDIPTIELSYGTIPVTHISAGMKRILGLAYLLVWTWYEHTQAITLLNQEPAKRLILLMDEVEAHLHPQWQRSLLSSLLTVSECLKQQIHTQVIVTTHSPLVLASAEPLFDEEQDKLFLFELENRQVSLHDIVWAKQGDTVGWLTSDIFGLQQARSREKD